MQLRGHRGCREVHGWVLGGRTEVALEGLQPIGHNTGRASGDPSGPQTVTSLQFQGAHGRIRTCDARFRKPTLYPLSYVGLTFRSFHRERFRGLYARTRTGPEPPGPKTRVVLLEGDTAGIRAD